MTKANQLRDLFNQQKVIYVMGAHNGLSAKLVERNGFDAIWASGLEISASYAVPDANILTMTQYLEKSEEMNEASSLPIVSDCDTGYGNSNNVIYMMKKYESAGIAAVCIEDKLFPKVNSFIQGRQELAPIAEFVGKIMAAKSVQRDSNMMLIARVEALIAGWDEEEALLRADRYVEAGADAILIHSKRTDYQEIVSFAKKWDRRAPLVIVPTTYPSLMKDFSDDDLAKLGIKMVIFANQGLRASIKAMDQTMATIRKTRGTNTMENEIAPLKDVFELQGMVEMKDSEKKYLRTNASEFNVIFLAAGEPQNQDDLQPLLRDRPVALLDINGQSLIKRNMNTLSRFSVSNTTVVVGYCSEQFDIEGVNLIYNPDFKEKHILHSLMMAEDSLKGKTLFAYGDVLFDRNIIERLLKCEEDIVVVGDATFKKMNTRNRQLDLLVTDTVPSIQHRIFDNESLCKVQKIGNHFSEDEAHYEFVGLALFSDKGIESLKKVYHELKASNKKLTSGKPFSRAAIDDILQEMILRQYPVSMLEVNSGWIEIHTFENYKAACHLLSLK
jgi:phosphoenolpyruvate phosphomutase